ncbi:MAG: hypothetical protein QOI40_75 [Alphaproteobacteria bacterium]|nr:hypothetical protein [Alphaproteobacteria bacterium]
MSARIAAMVLIAGLSVAQAAPNVPPGEQPGRERERFTPSPLDRFMQPSQPAEPLIRFDCDARGEARSQHRAKRAKDC